MRWLAPRQKLALVAVGLGLLAVLPPGLAAGPTAVLAPGAAASPASAAAPAASQPSLEDWRARLAEARQRHDELQRQPPGSAPLLNERQLASTRLLALLSDQVDAASAQAPDAPPPPAPVVLPGPGPYSVVEVDALRDRIDEIRAQRAALQLSLKSLEGEVEAAIANRSSANATLNLRRDQAGRPLAGNDAEQQAQLELASLRAQAAALEVLQVDMLRASQQARLASLDAPMVQLDREFARVRPLQTFDEATLAQRLKALDADALALEAELRLLDTRIAQRSQKAATADSTRGRELEALNGARAALRELQTLLRRMGTAWRARHGFLASAPSPEVRRSMGTQINSALEQASLQLRNVVDRHALLRIELRSGLAGGTAAAADGPARADEQRLHEAQQMKLDALQRLEEALHRSTVLLTRMRDDLALDQKPQDAQGWALHGLDLARNAATAIWQHELFSATESTVIDGRVVTVDYGVTVGKSLGLLVLLVAGYWAAGALARVIAGQLRIRLHLTETFAHVLQRWISTILLLLVFLLVLRAARIPLTAFAFLGGALAIGVGFGTQNIIKNLISGVIILFERKIRVGDVVTIGGVSGTVQTVDFRATTVRGFDGIDAIVPNSALLENQISNWSGGGPSVRRALVVGVAYGCDVRLAADLVTGCAQAHAAVQREPAPEVFFDDFGSDALMLRLLYWTRLGGARTGSGVDSDLRFAIERALREAGIAIAFPQRDVHLDLAGPVKVELVGPSPPPTPPAPPSTTPSPAAR